MMHALIPLLFLGLTVKPTFTADQWVAANERIELRLSELYSERLAVFIGNRDVTTLFEVTPTALRYRAGVPPLPAGNQELIVYTAPASGDWREIGRFPMKVLTRGGFRKSEIKPSVDLTNKGQLDQDSDPPVELGDREHYQDLTAQMGLSTEHQRGNITVRSQTNLTGVSYVNEALRFGEKGDDAPQVDLASYRIDIQGPSTTLALGHVGFGNARHLLNGFSSRGLVFTLGTSRPVSFSFGALNGTSIVGWDNILGFHEREHRMYGAALALELVRSRPGAARVETTIFNGSILPLNGFTDAGARSAEKSQGGAVRLTVASPSSRFTLDGGWTRSRFRPQSDPQLEAGLDVTPIHVQQRDAMYADINLGLVPSRMVGRQSASLSATVNFERVEPLFRSVGAFAQADFQRGSVSLNGQFGPVSLQVSQMLSEDNLEDVRSILKTKTRQTSANVGLALASLFGARRGARWIPVLNASANQMHQYGAFLPENAGFSESHVPDQVSLSVQGGLEWQIAPVRFGARGSFSDQDNRQPGRVLADFRSNAGTLYVGLTPSPKFDVSLEGSLEEQQSLEFDKRDRTRRYGITANWRFFRDLALAGNYSKTYGRDGTHTNERNSSEAFAELSSGFRLWRSRPQQNQSRLFVRYAKRDASTFDRLFGVNSANDGWTLTSGVNLSVY